MTIDDKLIQLVDRLNESINICYTAPDKDGQGYPFATGWALSAMTEVANDLSSIVKQLREENV